MKRWAGRWKIPTDHFDPGAASNEALRRGKIPIDEILVEHSTYSRSQLKARLFDEGLKERECELCGQGEWWRGRRMSLILDHINGIRDDNRIENLRIVCPNCAATLETHCGRNKHGTLDLPDSRECVRCGKQFRPKYWNHRYCSRACGTRAGRTLGKPIPDRRKVERPPHETLIAEVREMGYCAVGRKYGVSDQAIRKWLRLYERETAIREGRDPKVVDIPKRTWPNRKRAA